MKRIVFLNRFYWPEEPATAQLLADLAEGLAARGYAVTVVARRPPSTVRAEMHAGVAIERVRSTHWGRHSLIGRAIDFASFHLAAAGKLIRLLRRGDTLVAMTDPPLIGITALLIARIRGARLVHWVQDVYPEIAADLTGHRSVLALRPLRNLAWRSADACVVLGTDMSAAIRAAGVPEAKLRIWPNWAPVGLGPPPPESVAALRRAWGLEGKFVAAYAGNLGRAHDLEPLLEVARHLRDDPAFVVIFIGDGNQRIGLEAAAREQSLPNVRFFPLQRRRDLAPALALGDVQFVTLRPGGERWVFPSKFYCAAAVGRPIIFVGPKGCEIARLVETGEFGSAFERNEAAAIAAQLRHLRDHPVERAASGEAALRFAEHGAARAADAWDRLLGPALVGRESGR